MTERKVSSERVSEERLREIIAGCEGVSPGPWVYGTKYIGRYVDGDTRRYVAIAVAARKDYYSEEWDRDASHITRLDPSTVKAMASELLALRSSVKTETRVKAGDTVRVLRCQNVYGEDVYSFSSKPFQPGETFVVGHVETDSAFARNIVFPVGEDMDFWPEDDLEILSAIEAPVAPSEVTEEMVEWAAKAMASKDGNPRNWQLYAPDARVALTAALKGDR